MNESITSFFIFMIWWQMTILQSWAKCDEGNFFCFVANSSRQVQKHEGGWIRRLGVSTAASVPRGLPGQMENKPLYLHGMLHWPSPSTRLRLCPTKQLLSERLWSGAPTRQSARASCDVWRKEMRRGCAGSKSTRRKAPDSLLLFYGIFCPPHAPRQNICVSIYEPDATADVCEYFIPPSQQRVVTTNIMRSLPRRREASSFAQRVVENAQRKGRRAFKWRAMNEWMSSDWRISLLCRTKLSLMFGAWFRKMENSAETTVLFLREPIINDKIADSRFYNEWMKCIETGNVDPS